jgi:hypothetical protein
MDSAELDFAWLDFISTWLKVVIQGGGFQESGRGVSGGHNWEVTDWSLILQELGICTVNLLLTIG